MFSALIDGVRGTPKSSARAEMTRASSSESALSAITVDGASNAQSSSSTPPTSIGDSVSVSSASLKLENTESTPAGESPGRSRRRRTSVGTYNVKVLSGTAIHAPKKYCKNQPETGNEPRRRTISGDTLVGAVEFAKSSSSAVEKDAERLVGDGIDALDLQWSVKKLPKSRSQISLGRSPKKSAKQSDLERRKSVRSPGPSLKKKFSVLGKRGRQTFEDSMAAGLVKVKRELRNLADTNEYAKIDTKPVIHEVWSNGKLVTAEPPKKKKKVEEATAPMPVPAAKTEVAKSAEKKKVNGKREKVWLSKGLYAGQDRNLDWFSSYTEQMRKETNDMPDFKPDGVLPLPMWHGQRLLHIGRHFKLPFDVCSPLPPGQPKPDEWRKTSSNRFVGEAGALWKKSNLFDSFSSKCVCTPEGGCDEDCQNRIMLYECDSTNCASGRDHCTNRAFAQLQERRKGGGKYRIGVEVIKTADRGYGVRSNRCFDANQIIVEYTGEIITEDECDRRMNEDYKNNDCYYLMSFDQNMIIDATKGSIARFVNHSCKPNCRMVKWIVGGKPRMALFAGDNPIMSGDELTYDYNFDPFSAKNVQECRCGSDNCRGVLGPRPKDQKPVTIKDAVKAGVKAGKRKLKELLSGGVADEEDRSPKKRKIKEAKGIKRSASSASMRVAKGAAKAVRKTVSTSLLNARQAVGSKRGSVIAVRTRKVSTVKTYSKQGKLSSRKLSLTMVAGDSSLQSKGRRSVSTQKKVQEAVVKNIHGIKQGGSSRDAEGGTIRVITDGEDEDEE